MKQDNWAIPNTTTDTSGMTHAEAVKALIEGKTVKLGDTVLKLDGNGKANHNFTQEELHSGHWKIVADVESPVVVEATYFDLNSLQTPEETTDEDTEQLTTENVTEEETEETAKEESIKEEGTSVDEKTRLQEILNEAQVPFSPRLGITKLQALVDSLDEVIE